MGKAIQSQDTPSRTYSRLLKLVACLTLALLIRRLWSVRFPRETPLVLDDICPQVLPLTAPEHEELLKDLDEEFDSSAFRLKAYASLAGAVRIPTENHDDYGLPSEDPRWGIMGEFHDYLESRFPRVHATLTRTKVNMYALIYEWKGIENVKPLMIAAHIDVVPVNPDTYDDWIHPPYSGYYDGEWIWGRGSYDAKPLVIGSLTTIETLLIRGFVPSRTVLLAFGFDEESDGERGAGAINEYLLETYGPDSLAMIIDEGNTIIDLDDMLFAPPAVSEKGFMDIRMEVLTPGGHSSTPPKHTGIGILADLIKELEAHPHRPELIRGTTYYQTLECRARHDGGFPDALSRLLKESQTSDDKLRELGDRLIEFDPKYYALTGTTQAVDVVRGGVKVNALPEAAWAAVNHRIAEQDSLAWLMARFTNIALLVAVRHNMTLEAFGEDVGPAGPSWGTIRLSDFSSGGFEAAPVTPGMGSGPFELLSGTIRSTIQTSLRTDIPKLSVVSPGIMTENTDTRHYWNLTRHIFRYNHRDEENDAFNGAHTINEAIRAEAFLEHIRFYARLILNADQSDLLE